MLFSTIAFAADINVNVNGEAVAFANQKPVIVEGRTLIPLRGVFEKLGYEVSWDGETKTATLANEANTVVVKTGEAEIKVNEATVVADVPAQIINGSMMIPLRAIGEGTGGEVNWDSETKTANITVSAQEEKAEEEQSSEVGNYIKAVDDASNPSKVALNEAEALLGAQVSGLNSTSATAVEKNISAIKANVTDENVEAVKIAIDEYNKKFEATKAELEKITPPESLKEYHELTIQYLEAEKNVLNIYGDFVQNKASKEDVLKEVSEAKKVIEKYFIAVISMTASF